MADFWIIEYKVSKMVDDADSRVEHQVEQHIAVDVDSVVTIEKSDAGVGKHIVHVDTGYTYHGNILKKVTEDDVIAEMDKLPANTSRYL